MRVKQAINSYKYWENGLFSRGQKNGKKIDFKNLVKAIQNTFKNRKTELNIEEIREQLSNMKTSEQLIKSWEKYQITAPYSSDISFENLFDSLDYITNILSEEEAMV